MCCLSDSSSTEERPFDIVALSTCLRVRLKDVKHVVDELHQEGLPKYAEGEHIPKSDVHVIAELGLGLQYPPPRGPKVSPQHGFAAKGDPIALACHSDADPEDAELKHRLEKVCRSQPSGRLFDELRRCGFRLGGDRGHHIYSHAGHKFVLRQTRWDPAVDFPKLWSFVAAERWDGMYCGRCQSWFKQEELDDAHHAGSAEYAPDGGCLGACKAAHRWASKNG